MNELINLVTFCNNARQPGHDRKERREWLLYRTGKDRCEGGGGNYGMLGRALLRNSWFRVQAGSGSKWSRVGEGEVGQIRKLTSVSKGALTKNMLHVWFCNEVSQYAQTCLRSGGHGNLPDSRERDVWSSWDFEYTDWDESAQTRTKCRSVLCIAIEGGQAREPIGFPPAFLSAQHDLKLEQPSKLLLHTGSSSVLARDPLAHGILTAPSRKWFSEHQTVSKAAELPFTSGLCRQMWALPPPWLSPSMWGFTFMVASIKETTTQRTCREHCKWRSNPHKVDRRQIFYVLMWDI